MRWLSSISQDAEREANSKLERVSVDEIFELQRNELVNKMEKEKLKMKEGFSLGNCLDFLDDY